MIAVNFYRIYNNVSDRSYVGSTHKEDINLRFKEHLSEYESFKAGKRSIKKLTSSWLVIDEAPEGCDIELLESGNYGSEVEIKIIEAKYIGTYNCVNIVKPTSIDTSKLEYTNKKEYQAAFNREYSKLNRETINEKERKRRANNLEIYKARDKLYRDNNKEALKVKRLTYEENNKEALKLKRAEYRENNKEYINRRELCTCGETIMAIHRNRHLLTKKHAKKLSELVEVS